MLLHGGGQTAAEFATATGMDEVADRRDALIAYPQQSRGANPHRYWNWFSPEHQKRGQGEPALLAELAQSVAREWAIAPNAVHLGGFSAGGAMAAVVAATYPERFAAVGIHSGLPYRSASDLLSALQAMQQGARPDPEALSGPPLLVIHGDHDGTVSPVNARRLLAPVAARCVASTVEIPASGHDRAVRRTDYRDGAGRLAGSAVLVHGGGHAWFGGRGGVSYSDPSGPSASELFAEFFAHAGGH